MHASTLGIKKVKLKAVIPGVRASVRTQDSSPTFYFYFEDRAAGLGKGLLNGNLSSPNQFALVKLEVSKSNRETVVMASGAFGASSGTDANAMIGFKFERVRSGVYKVTLNSPLKDGEYCFLAGLGGERGAGATGAAGAVDIFDFGSSTK